MAGVKWWDGYSGQSSVIIDDYRRDLCTFSELLRMLDSYPYRVERKGSSCQFRATDVVITTPKHPRATWEGRTDEEIGQLLRRIEFIGYFANPGAEAIWEGDGNVPIVPTFNPSGQQTERGSTLGPLSVDEAPAALALANEDASSPLQSQGTSRIFSLLLADDLLTQASFRTRAVESDDENENDVSVNEDEQWSSDDAHWVSCGAQSIKRVCL